MQCHVEGTQRIGMYVDNYDKITEKVDTRLQRARRGCPNLEQHTMSPSANLYRREVGTDEIASIGVRSQMSYTTPVCMPVAS